MAPSYTMCTRDHKNSCGMLNASGIFQIRNGYLKLSDLYSLGGELYVAGLLHSVGLRLVMNSVRSITEKI